MRTCRAIKLLSHALPVPAWKGNVLEHHLERCPDCRAELAVRDEARAYVFEPSSMPSRGQIWPVIEAGLAGSPEKGECGTTPRRLFWKLAAGTTVLAALGLVVLITRSSRAVGVPSSGTVAEDFRLDSAEAMGRQAKVLIYQPRDSGITIIWMQ